MGPLREEGGKARLGEGHDLEEASHRRPAAARKALESGEIDMYWEYTGTGWITHLGHRQIHAVGQQVQRRAQRPDHRSRLAAR